MKRLHEVKHASSIDQRNMRLSCVARNSRSHLLIVSSRCCHRLTIRQAVHPALELLWVLHSQQACFRTDLQHAVWSTKSSKKHRSHSEYTICSMVKNAKRWPRLVTACPLVLICSSLIATVVSDGSKNDYYTKISHPAITQMLRRVVSVGQASRSLLPLLQWGRS